MAVDEVLARLGPTDPPPTLEELGGEDAAVAAVPVLDPDLVPRLIEALMHHREPANAPLRLASELAQRLPDVEAPIAAASSMDALVAFAAVGQEADLSRTLMKSLLTVVETQALDDRHAVRASYAIRAATDLALLKVGVTVHGVLATIENLDEVRPEMAPGMARAVGRLWEHHEAGFLQQVLEERVLPHEEAAADALLELGLEALRRAFNAVDSDSARAGLERAVELFDRAKAQEEDRPDARAFAAAARAVLAFDVDAAAMTEALGELELARGELDRYSAQHGDGYRGAAPLRSVAAWHVLAATLRGLRAHVDRPNALHLRPAVEAMVDAYAGMRLAVLDDERLGLQAFIAPLIERAVSGSGVLAEGVKQYAEEGAAGATDLAAEVVLPKAGTTPTLIRRRRRRRP